MYIQDCQDTAQQVSGLEVAVEQPFSTDFSFSAPPRTQSIMPPPSGPSQTPQPALGLSQAALAQTQGVSKGTHVLPLGSAAILVAKLTIMAPCQVTTHCIMHAPSRYCSCLERGSKSLNYTVIDDKSMQCSIDSTPTNVAAANVTVGTSCWHRLSPNSMMSLALPVHVVMQNLPVHVAA